MRLVEIYSGLIWSVCYEGDKRDVFSRLFAQWIDIEYLDTFINKNKRFLEGNLHFAGYTLKEVILETQKEAFRLRKDFSKYYWNEINGDHPDFDDRFFILNRGLDIDDLKRKMYGHQERIGQMTSVLRLYAIKVPPDDIRSSAAYIITGGGIKLSDAMSDMKELAREYHKMEMVQDWLRQKKIKNKRELIEKLTNGNYANDGMGRVGVED